MKKIKTLLIGLFIASLLITSPLAASFRELKNTNYKAEAFSEGLFLVKDNNTQKYGYVDINGNIAISFAYRYANSFQDGVAAVTTMMGETYLIDRTGKKVADTVKQPISDYPSFMKHGDYGAVAVDTKNGFQLVDTNWNPLLPEKTLSSFRPETSSHTYYNSYDGYGFYFSSIAFFKDSNGNIYNYKGVNLTEKLAPTGITPVAASNSYFVGLRGKALALFDVDGNPLSEIDLSSFGGKTTIKLTDHFIYAYSHQAYGENRDSIYTVAGKTLFDDELSDNSYYANSINFFDNYVAVRGKKYGNTCALFRADGETIINYGLWDVIVPSANNNRFAVCLNGKWGIADQVGNLIVPLTYPDSRYFYVSDINDNDRFFYFYDSSSESRIYINVFTDRIKTLHVTSGGYNTRFLRTAGTPYGILQVGDYYLVDQNMNTITTLSKSNSFPGPSSWNTYSREGVFFKSRDYLHAVILNDGGGIKVRLDRKDIVFDQPPVIIGGRTLVPLRRIFELLGATVQWDAATKTVTSTKNGTTVQMQIGNVEMTINGKPIRLDTAPQIIGGRTLVPVRAVAEAFNMVVDWNAYSKTVELFSA